jgi:putative ABC transport system permease protein
MNTLDVLRLTGGTLTASGRRTGLSLLGMSIGIAAVLVLTGLGEGARGFVRAQFEVIGTNVVAVLPGKVETSGGLPGFGGVPNDLTIRDAEVLARGIPQALRVAPVHLGNETVAVGNRSRQVLVFGSTAEIQPIRNLVLRSGRFLPTGPWSRGNASCVLGSKLVRELFPGQNPLGGIVSIGGWRVRVIGVLAPKGVTFGIDLDEIVFVPVALAQRLFDRSSLFRVVLQVRPGANVAAVQEHCTALLVERHGEEDFTITTPDAILSSLDSVLGILTMALVGIASISLCVAGVGIMNVMLVSVAERRGEIGVLKALGASPRQVLVLFLTEAAVLSILGGLLGLSIGAGLLRVFTLLYPNFPVHAPAWAIAASLALAVVVGIAFGLWPAARAVRLDPVVAMSGRAG